MSFHVGQLVVCVDDTNQFFGPAPPPNEAHLLVRGRIYRVRWLGKFRGGDCLRVDEIMRAAWGVTQEDDWPFATRRFRPVDETHLEVFRSIARNPREHIRIGEDA